MNREYVKMGFVKINGTLYVTLLHTSQCYIGQCFTIVQLNTRVQCSSCSSWNIQFSFSKL